MSVAMPVHNGERYLRLATDSILSQSFAGFEFIIIDDGSTDGTAQILKEYEAQDDRVVVHHQENRGTAAATNRAIELARGKYIAIMHQDDVAFPDRIQRQVEVLEANPQIAVLGTAAILIDSEGRRIMTWRFPLEHGEMANMMEIGSPMVNPTVLMRTQAFRSIQGGYRSFFAYAEDYDLWLRMAERHTLANLSEPLLSYRFHLGNGSIGHFRSRALAELSARAVSRMRRVQGSEPGLDWDRPVTQEAAAGLGISEPLVKEVVVREYLHVADMMLRAGRVGFAGYFLDEAAATADDDVPSGLLADLHWARARALRWQGRRSDSVLSALRAFARRPALMKVVVGGLPRRWFRRVRAVGRARRRRAQLAHKRPA